MVILARQLMNQRTTVTKSKEIRFPPYLPHFDTTPCWNTTPTLDTLSDPCNPLAVISQIEVRGIELVPPRAGGTLVYTP